MKKLKIYFPAPLFDEKERGSWFELLKSKDRLQRNNRPIDKRIQEKLQWVESPEEADKAILPHDWSFYYQRKREREALQFCEQMNAAGKQVLSSSGGDQGITVPVSANVLVYRQSGYRSTLKPNERTAPFFLSDPITAFLNKEEKDVLKTNPVEKPILGFCGMAPHGLATALKEKLQISIRNAKSVLGLSPNDTQAVLSSSNLRYRALQVFKESPDFKTNYLIRQKYRGGIQTPENRQKTTDEYYQNQIDSDLVLCVRGVGNFSLRFYETLAMGRIPIFVDTDSPLPDIGVKNWRDYLIWVDSKDINRAPAIAQKWLKSRNLREQQRKNRQLWVEHFRGDNFWLREITKLQSTQG